MGWLNEKQYIVVENMNSCKRYDLHLICDDEFNDTSIGGIEGVDQMLLQ